MFEQFGAADAFEEREPQQQIYIRHKCEGMLGELRSKPVRWICKENPATFRCSFLLQEIADEVQVKAVSFNVGGDDRNPVGAKHVHDVAVTGCRLPDTRHRVQHIRLGCE